MVSHFHSSESPIFADVFLTSSSPVIGFLKWYATFGRTIHPPLEYRNERDQISLTGATDFISIVIVVPSNFPSTEIASSPDLSVRFARITVVSLKSEKVFPFQLTH